MSLDFVPMTYQTVLTDLFYIYLIMLIKQPESEVLQRQNRQLMRLSYLQLCTVPAIIPKYLSLFEIEDIRNMLILHCQTFLHLHNNNHLNCNPRNSEFVTFVQEGTNKAIGRQLMSLLRHILLYAIDRKLPLEQIILKLDSSTDLYITTLFKMVLKTLTQYSPNARVHADYIAAVISLMELSVELNEVRIGNSKFLPELGNKIDDNQVSLKQQQYIKARKLQETELLLAMLATDMNEHYESLANFGFELLKQYQFVIMDTTATTIVENSNTPGLQLQFPIQVEQDFIGDTIESEESILDSYNFQETDELKQVYLTNLCLSSLKNINNLSLDCLSKIYNTISLAIHQSFQQSPAKANLQKVAQYKSNNYCLLNTMKILLAARSGNANWMDIIAETEQTARSIFEFKLPNIEKIWLLLYALIQFDIEKLEVVDRLISMFQWMIQHYAKRYIISQAEYIYADYLIICKSILTSWKNQIEQPEQHKTERSSLLGEIEAWLEKPYEKKQFQLLAETLNLQLLNYLITLFFEDKTTFTFSNLFELEGQTKDTLQPLLANSQKQLINYMNTLKSTTVIQSLQEQTATQPSGDMKIVLNVWLQRSPNNDQKHPEWSIFVQLNQIFDILNSNSSLSHKKKLVSHLSQKCLKVCSLLVIRIINDQLMEYSMSTKKYPNAKASDCDRPQSRGAILQNMQFILSFLYLLLFTLSPSENSYSFLHALVINGYLNQNPVDEAIAKASEMFSRQPNLGRYIQIYEPILKYAATFDVLDCFYEYVLEKRAEEKKKYEQFCREWCSNQNHYQWLSQHKTKRIKLIKFKEYCLEYICPSYKQ